MNGILKKKQVYSLLQKSLWVSEYIIYSNDFKVDKYF